MENLYLQECSSCSKDASPLADKEASQLLKDLPEWRIEEYHGEKTLYREYVVKDFAAALRFTNGIGELAESENHHPEILLGWGKVNVRWWTHKIKGLHMNDFVLAARSEKFYQEFEA